MAHARFAYLPRIDLRQTVLRMYATNISKYIVWLVIIHFPALFSSDPNQNQTSVCAIKTVDKWTPSPISANLIQSYSKQVR